MAYAELCARTCFSLLEGASQPREVVEAASSAGVSHLGIVDRDCVYGVVQAHKTARDHDLHLILGATVTVDGRPPLVLLARDADGWSSLSRLLTRGRARCPKGLSRVTLAEVVAEEAGLHALLPYGWTVPWARHLREVFDARLAIVATRDLRPADRVRTRWACSLARVLEVPLVASNAPLYHAPERQPLADVLTCIRRRTRLEAAGRCLQRNAERHVLTDAVFRARWADLPEAVEAGLAIAEMCRFRLDTLHYTYPREVVPDGYTPMAWLRHEVERGLRWRYPGGEGEAVRRQIAHELAVIEDLDFPSYILTVYDIVRYARSRGILCQGRGSAANSAVCFVLGITAVDPSRSTLLFERFISKERGEPPDIDVDFEHERREEVIQYIYDRYGRDRAALVNEFITYRGRSAIRDVGRVFGLSLDQVDRLAKTMDRWSAGSDATSDELVREAGLDPDAGAIRSTLSCAVQLRGLPRHLSIHVGGFVIAADKLTDLVPVEPATMADRTVIQWDKYDVEALRFVKVDVLGLGMLTCIRRAFGLVERHTGQRWTLATVPSEDAAVYDMFCRADTVGVFQIESRAQMSMLPRLRPRCFYDLVIEVAIVRPGPIQGDMVHPYLRRRNGEEAVDYPSEDLRRVLQKTLGVPLFQEQAMKVAIVGAGFTPSEADRLRRAMATFRHTGTIHTFREKMIDGMLERGYEADFAERCFRQIEGFGDYGFPESHAASFALLVYVSAWMKRHYPAVFTCALLNSQPMGFYAPAQLVRDAREHGVIVRPPDVNFSQWDCILELDEAGEGAYALRLGLRQIRGLKEADGEWVVAARGNRYADPAAIWRRAGLDGAALEKLARADAFASMGLSRREALWAARRFVAANANGDAKPLPLFEAVGDDGWGAEAPVTLPEMPLGEAVMADYASIRMSLRCHPMALLRDGFPRTMPAEQLIEAENESWITVVGLVLARQRPGTAKGVIFATLEDETGVANVIVWPKIYERFRRIVLTSRLLKVAGRLQREGIVTHLITERLEDCSPLLDSLSERGAEDLHGPRPVPPAKSGFRHPRNQGSVLFPSRDFH